MAEDKTAEQLRANELSVGEISFNAWQKAEGRPPRERWDAAANAAINAHCSDPARIVDELASRFPLVVVAKHINAALPGLINFVASLSTVDTRADSGEAVDFDGPKDDRSMLVHLMQAFDTESWQCPQCGKDEECATMDSAYLLRDYLAAHPSATSVDVRALAFAAIEAETELTDDMPDEMWLHLHDDRDAVTEALRITVRQTKQSIRERLQAAIASREGR